MEFTLSLELDVFGTPVTCDIDFTAASLEEAVDFVKDLTGLEPTIEQVEGMRK